MSGTREVATEGKVRAPELVVVGSLLFVFLALFFHQSLIPGRVLNGADLLFLLPAFVHGAPDGFQGPVNSLLFDQVLQFTPWRKFAVDTLSQGQLPLWNPHSLSGTPFVATMQAAVFYPINLLLTGFPFELTFVLSAMLRLWIAGFFTYLLARQYALGRWPSAIAAASFMFCGFIVVWLGHPHTNVAIWLPALIWLAELLITAQTRALLLRCAAGLALVIGVQLTGGHIATSVDILTALGLYLVVRGVQLSRTGHGMRVGLLRAPLLYGAAAGVLGLLIAGAQLAPFLEWLPLSNEFQRRAVRSFELVDLDFWKSLATAPLLVFPNLYSNPTWGFPHISYLPWGSFSEDALYVGVLTLALAAIGLAIHLKSQAIVQAWTIIGLIALGRTFHLPIFDWLNYLPGLSLGNPGRVRLILAFSLCMVAGFGAHALFTSSRSRPRVLLLKLCSAVAAAGVLMALLGSLVLPSFRDQLVAFGRERVDVEFARRAVHSSSISEYYTLVDTLADRVISSFQPTNFALYTPAIVAGLTLLVFRLSRRREGTQRFVAPALTSLVVLDLAVFAWGYHPAIPIDNFYPTTPILRELGEDRSLFRATALDRDLLPDVNLMWGFSDIRGLDYPTRWYSQYMNLIPDRKNWLPYGTLVSSLESPLLKVLNVKYFISSLDHSDVKMQDVDVKVIDREVGLMQLAEVQPRSFMVHEALFASSDSEAQRWLSAEPARVFDRVVLQEAPYEPATPLLPQGVGDATRDQVTLLSYSPSEASWSTQSDRPAYLVTTDAYYPGWSAYVDGRQVDVYRANVAFRALYLPPGEHVVTYRYEPKSVALGLILSAVGLLVAGAMLMSSFRFRTL